MARARQFDNEKVLEAAQSVFWEKGYHPTSTRDLTAAMGMTTASVYNAFGDKRGLFLAALGHYLDHSLRERMSRLESTLPPADAISGFFADTIARSLSDPLRRGCMLVNTALEARDDDPEIRETVAAETLEMEAFFVRCARAAQETGSGISALPAEDIGKMLLSVALGLRVLARVRPDAQVLFGLVRPALALLGLPPLKEPPS
ncbi:MAG: TetR/AcrR family transcriptional regulator [Rhizobium sp.]|nr:MAG: TetR/AcrR family transcriptional regulator [Rhizobium sp.]